MWMEGVGGDGKEGTKGGVGPINLGPIGFTLLALKPTKYNLFMGSSWSKR
jgi:hypothetical protein